MRIVLTILLVLLILVGCSIPAVPTKPVTQPTTQQTTQPTQPDHRHTLVEVPAKAPTRLADGNLRYYKCTVEGCGAVFKDFTGATPTTLEAVTVAAEGFDSYEYHVYNGESFSIEKLTTITNDHACQGTAIYENTLLICNKYGYCYLYTLPKGEFVADFPLGSFDDSDNPTQNHSNQMMFGPEKFDESDPLPLLYVTTGYSNDHDPTGAYYAKCSVERIRQDKNGKWYAEIVQTIEFNDAANIPDSDINGTLKKMYQNGKFLYTSGNGYDVAKGYEKIGYGWPHFYVDMAPTDETEGKLFIWSTRFRASEAWEAKSHEKYEFTDYYTDNNYIITEFDMPALPESETDSEYGATVTLYPKDITHQFQTPFTVYAFQGGTMYNGKIFHSFGDAKQDKKHRDTLVVWDVAQERIVQTLALHRTEVKAWEPECVCIYNGELALSAYNMNPDNRAVNIYIFGYVADEDKTCLVCGEKIDP